MVGRRDQSVAGPTLQKITAAPVTSLCRLRLAESLSLRGVFERGSSRGAMTATLEMRNESRRAEPTERLGSEIEGGS